jgi:hypothetical protein
MIGTSTSATPPSISCRSCYSRKNVSLWSVKPLLHPVMYEQLWFQATHWRFVYCGFAYAAVKRFSQLIMKHRPARCKGRTVLTVLLPYEVLCNVTRFSFHSYNNSCFMQLPVCLYMRTNMSLLIRQVSISKFIGRKRKRSKANTEPRCR